jgi:hypothetical protein
MTRALALLVAAIAVGCSSADLPAVIGPSDEDSLSDPAQVVVAPAEVQLAPGATQQFTATIPNRYTQKVTWSVDRGSIDATGLYTAPAAECTATITAAWVVNPARTGTALADPL